MTKWLKRIGMIFAILFTFLLILGFSYEQISRSSAEQTHQRPGQLVDLGGHKLHVLKKGNGGPTVVFESGLGYSGHLPWFEVQEEVAKFATTVSYDRAGLLWSERGENPKTAAAIATELNELLNSLGLEKPYILVGHSLAGVTLRPYVLSHTEDVGGMILVDGSHPDMEKHMSDRLKKEMLSSPPSSLLIKAAVNFGVARAMLAQSTQPNTEKDDNINQVVNSMFHKSLTGFIDEVATAEQMMAEVSDMRALGDFPLTVITAISPARLDNTGFDDDLKKELLDLWLSLQKDLTTLSSNSTHVLAPESGHFIQLEQPELVVEAIRDMVAKTSAVSAVEMPSVEVQAELNE
jgi:pimeloyl-ACP methyl ester carboxylesterase